MEYIKEFNAYRELVNEESKRIHDILAKYIKENGGEIETSNEDNQNDAIYAMVYNDFSECYTDYRIDKVRVTNDYVEVHVPDYYSEDENDLWFSVYGGMVMIIDTLYSLCECLPEYVSNEG